VALAPCLFAHPSVTKRIRAAVTPFRDAHRAVVGGNSVCGVITAAASTRQRSRRADARPHRNPIPNESDAMRPITHKPNADDPHHA
jgi:hypothetical protein